MRHLVDLNTIESEIAEILKPTKRDREKTKGYKKNLRELIATFGEFRDSQLQKETAKRKTEQSEKEVLSDTADGAATVTSVVVSASCFNLTLTVFPSASGAGAARRRRGAARGRDPSRPRRRRPNTNPARPTRGAHRTSRGPSHRRIVGLKYRFNHP